MTKKTKIVAKASKKQIPKRIKMTFECTEEDRVYIKMLATKQYMTLSELILFRVKASLSTTPNAETIAAFEESERDLKEGKLKSYSSIEEMWKDLGIDPNA